MRLLQLVGASVNASRRTLAGTALLVVLGCGSDPPSGTSEPPEFELDSRARWGGASVDVRSASFNGLPRLPVFTANQDTMAVERLDDYTLRLTLPPSTGIAHLILHEGLAVDTIASIPVFGVGVARQVPGNLGIHASALPGSPVRFIAGGRLTVQILDPASGLLELINGVGPTLDNDAVPVGPIPDVFVLRDSLGRSGAWELLPTPLFLDSVPAGALSYDAMALLSDSIWMGWSARNVFTVLTGRTSPLRTVGVSDAGRIIVSPRKDLVIPIPVHAYNALVPVVDVTTGMIAFSLAGVGIANGAGFSPSGDTLFVSAWTGGVHSLKVFSVSTGVEVASAPLPAGTVGGPLVVGPEDGRVYILSSDGWSFAELLVFDRATLAVEGRISCPDVCPAAGGWFGNLAIDTATSRLWAVGPDWYPAGQIPIIGYDLLPPAGGVPVRH